MSGQPAAEPVPVAEAAPKTEPAVAPAEIAKAEPPAAKTPATPDTPQPSTMASQEPATEAPAAPSAETQAAKTEPPLAAAPAPSTTNEPVTAEAPPALATEPAATEPAAAVETEVAKVEPAAPESTPPTPPATIAPEILPSFDIVRVEPTGDAVIAGVAAPGATVELLDGGTVVATAKANERGEWAMALDRPLPAGTHDLSVRTTSADQATVTLSDQRVAVDIPSDGSDVLVVLNTPDAASRVIQLPATREMAEAKAADPKARIGATEAPGAPAGSGAEAADASTPQGTEIASASPTPEGTDAAATAGKGGTAVPAPEGAAAKEGAEGADPATAPSGSAEGDAVAASTPDTVEGAGAGEGPAATPDIVEGAGAGEGPAATPETKEGPKEPGTEPMVAIAAVEADTAGALFVAGTATTPEPVRVYLDGVPIGEATPSPSGTWLVEVARELPAGTYAVRADQVDETGNVIVRAEVPFDREIEVAVLKPTAEAGGPGGASATGTMAEPQTVIIKRRDNLWRLSRAMYGKGVRWSTLYQANKDQIRNPRWIYPGQVFVVPSEDMNWKE